MEKNNVQKVELARVAGFAKLTATAKQDAEQLFAGGVEAKFAIMFAGKSVSEVATAAVTGYGQFSAAVKSLYIKCDADFEAVRAELHKAGFDVNSSAYRMAKKRLLESLNTDTATPEKAASKADKAAESADSKADSSKGADQHKRLSLREQARILLADGALLIEVFKQAAANADLADQLDEYAGEAGLCIRTRPKGK